MITHRNAYMNVVGTLIHVPMTPADRYLWTLPMFHANGWTFVWIVTAVGGDARLPAQGRAGARLRADRAASASRMLCAAPTVLIGLANAPDELRRGAPRGVRVADRRRAAGRRDDRADRGRARLGRSRRSTA